MHGLINRSIQCFIRDNYGQSAWSRTADLAGVDRAGFEAMQFYPDGVTLDLLDAAGQVLDRAVPDLFEDIGTYLVSHPNTDSLRRLLRFGGASFEDFLYSLEDLPFRAKLAVPDLALPAFSLKARGNGEFDIDLECLFPEGQRLLVGLLRSIADDYGSFALVSCHGDSVHVSLLQTDFAPAHQFDLVRIE